MMFVWPPYVTLLRCCKICEMPKIRGISYQSISFNLFLLFISVALELSLCIYENLGYLYGILECYIKTFSYGFIFHTKVHYGDFPDLNACQTNNN